MSEKLRETAIEVVRVFHKPASQEEVTWAFDALEAALAEPETCVYSDPNADYFPKHKRGCDGRITHQIPSELSPMCSGCGKRIEVKE